MSTPSCWRFRPGRRPGCSAGSTRVRPVPELSGFLVPPGAGTLVKAATFVTRKWPALRRDSGPVIVRLSIGRAGEEERLQRDDGVLAVQAHAELSGLLGTSLPPAAASW